MRFSFRFVTFRTKIIITSVLIALAFGIYYLFKDKYPISQEVVENTDRMKLNNLINFDMTELTFDYMTAVGDSARMEKRILLDKHTKYMETAMSSEYVMITKVGELEFKVFGGLDTLEALQCKQLDLARNIRDSLLSNDERIEIMNEKNCK